MSQNSPSDRIATRSAFANLLTLSGFVGLAVGLSLELYRLYLVDSVLGGGSAPAWIEASRFALIVGSLAVLLYAQVLDDVFKGWYDLVVLCLLAGQWGVPLFQYLDATVGGPGSPYGFLIVVAAGLHALVGVLVAVNYIRRCWPRTEGFAVWRS